MMNFTKRLFTLLVCTVFSLISLSFSEVRSVKSCAELANIEKYEEMVIQVNEYRALYGLPPLKLYPRLCEAAEVRAREIEEFFSHTRPDGSSSSTIFELFNILKVYLGENIACHFKNTVEAVLGAWIASDYHRENILCEDYTHIGVGLYEKDGYYYWSQVFVAGYEDEYEDSYIPGEPATLSLISSEDILKGDVNNDGLINASDSSDLLSMYSKMSSGVEIEIDEEMLYRCDMNNDGVINASDASEILSYYSAMSSGQN